MMPEPTEAMITDMREVKVRILIAVDYKMEKALQEDIHQHLKGALELLNEEATAKIQSYKGRIKIEHVKAVEPKPKKGGNASSKTSGHASDSGVGTTKPATTPALPRQTFPYAHG